MNYLLYEDRKYITFGNKAEDNDVVIEVANFSKITRAHSLFLNFFYNFIIEKLLLLLFFFFFCEKWKSFCMDENFFGEIIGLYPLEGAFNK